MNMVRIRGTSKASARRDVTLQPFLRYSSDLTCPTTPSLTIVLQPPHWYTQGGDATLVEDFVCSIPESVCMSELETLVAETGRGRALKLVNSNPETSSISSSDDESPACSSSMLGRRELPSLVRVELEVDPDLRREGI